MRRPPVLRALLLALTVAVSAIAGLGAAAPPAGAVVFGYLKTYPTSVDVDLKITERTSWKGIQPGCYAPAENFGQNYVIDANSRPRGKASKIRTGTTTITAVSVGVTPSYGAKGGFRQFSSGAPWELETANPPSCSTAARPVPAWASSPTCKRITERVSALLVMEGNASDGRLVINRTPRAAALAKGATVGESCFRTLSDADTPQLATQLAINLRDTFIALPIRSLRAKMLALAEGSAGARPFFRLPIRISGDCREMKTSGSIGTRSDYTRSPWNTLNRPLGSPSDLDKAASCTLEGSGDVTVTRVGRVVETSFRP
jgi:hypothetical protein